MFKCFIWNSCLSVSNIPFEVEKDLMQLSRKFLPSNKLVPLVADVSTGQKRGTMRKKFYKESNHQMLKYTQKKGNPF